MKILMASADQDNRALVVLAFKNLNAANSIDFVTTVEELMEYITTRIDSGRKLPDLLLFGLTVKDRDVISEIQIDSRLSNVKVVIFSIHVNDDLDLPNLNAKVYKASGLEELNWILNEICDGLVRKQGWQYSAAPSVRTAVLA